MTKISPLKYNRGYIRQLANRHYIASLQWAYVRYRRTFKSLAQAKAFIDQTVIQLENETRILSTYETEDARRSLAVLPEGFTLLEAAQHLAWVGVVLGDVGPTARSHTSLGRSPR